MVDKALDFNLPTKKKMPSVCRLKGPGQLQKGWWGGRRECGQRRHRTM